MGKEITLEELAANSRGVDKQQQQQEEAKPTAEVKEEPKKPVFMNPSQVEQTLIKAGKMKAHEDTTVDAPVVDKAFKAMNKRLQETKDFYTNVVNPIVEKNKQEILLERELAELEGRDPDYDNDGIAQDGADPNMMNQNNIPTVDEDEFDLDDESADYSLEVEERHFSNMNNNNEQKVEEPVQEENTIVEEEVIHINADGTTPIAKEQDDDVNVAKSVKSQRKVVEEDTPTVTQQDDGDGDLDSLLDDLDDSMNVVDTEEESTEEIRARFKKTFNAVKITSNPINFNEFKIRKNAVESSFVLSSINNHKATKTSDWALYHSKKSITFSECSGPELDNLRKTITNSNAINGVIASLRFVYDHIVDANKPKFEVWTKLIRTEDIESLYFGIYKACYSNTNIIARVCPTNTEELRKKNCGKTSLIDTPIMSMVKYGRENDDPEEIKAEFEKILQSDTTTDSEEFESTLMQVSDDIVISYCPATLFSTFIQFSTLKQEITQKYSDVLDSMAYIDGFYQIDRSNNELVPIKLQSWPGNFNKTVLHKLKFYTELLKSLTSDQYNVLIAKLANLIQPPKITYIYPEATCPECGAKIPEETVDSILNLLFSRAQLAQIKSL